MHQDKRSVLLILPCFNPKQQEWSRFFEFMSCHDWSCFEIIIVNDGSSHWAEPAQPLPSFVKIVHLDKNQGKGAVLKFACTCIQPTHNVFAFTDFDLPYSYDDLIGVCSGVLNAGSEMVIGDRSFQSENYASRFSRSFLHSFFRLFFKTIITGGVGDTQCGLKAYDAQCARLIAKKAKINSFLFDVEWIYIGLKHKLSLRCWPVSVTGSHVSTPLRKMKILRNLKDFVLIIVNIYRGEYFSEELLDLMKRRREFIINGTKCCQVK